MANLYEKLYEDNAEGKVTDEWFTHMSHKYELERTELKGKISDLRHRLSNAQETSNNKDMFIGAVRRFIEMETLTAPLAKELIDHIDVYESEGKGKNKTQRIVIYYRFVGYLGQYHHKRYTAGSSSKLHFRCFTRNGIKEKAAEICDKQQKYINLFLNKKGCVFKSLMNTHHGARDGT